MTYYATGLHFIYCNSQQRKSVLLIKKLYELLMFILTQNLTDVIPVNKIDIFAHSKSSIVLNNLVNTAFII